MPVLGAFIVPHPPIIMPEVGHGEEKKIQETINSYKKIAKQIAKLKPDTIILTTPHSIMYSDYFHISPGISASGSLSRFGAPDVNVKADYDTEFVFALEKAAQSNDIAAGTLGERDAALDHASVIPLYFINEEYRNYKLVRVGLSGLPFTELYRLGMCIEKTAESLSRNIVFVASGDLSHVLSEEGPYGYSEAGVQFDEKITDLMAKGDFLGMLKISPDFAETASECGLRSFIIMSGALDGREANAKLLSYEGPFGVGYAVASFIPKESNDTRKILDEYFKSEKERLQKVKDNEDAYVRLARYSVETYVTTHKYAPRPENLPKEMTENKAGVFVSLKKEGSLRGCIGTIGPVTTCIADEILRNAVSACAEDPRFKPLQKEELPYLVYSVDILCEPEPISSPDMLDVKRYGVIVTSASKRGLLLPNLEGIETVGQQIDIACKKAGIRDKDKISLERFEVVRHT